MSEILERFERIRRNHPARPLVHVPATRSTLTASALWDQSCAYRDALAAWGLGPDSLLIAASGNRAATLALWIALPPGDW